MINALIIDDPAAVDSLTLMVHQYLPEITELKTIHDPVKAFRLVRTFKPQLILLDLRSAITSGPELLQKLPGIAANILFITDHDQLMTEMVRFSGVGHLLKPFDGITLRSAFEKYMSVAVPPSTRKALYQNLAHNVSATEKKERRLALPATDGYYFFQPGEIIRLEGEADYTWFYFSQRKPLPVTRTIREFEELLGPYGFLQVHKSHLINRGHIIEFTENGTLTLSDHSQVDISRRRKEEIMELLRTG